MNIRDLQEGLAMARFRDRSPLRRLWWWLQKQPTPGFGLRAMRSFWQRGRRGWATSDVWNMSSYLARVIADMLKNLREEGGGWTCTDEESKYAHLDCTPDEWTQLLLRMEFGFRYYLYQEELECADPWWNLETATERARLRQEVLKQSTDLLGHWWEALWD
jgi:hypothetical protein